MALGGKETVNKPKTKKTAKRASGSLQRRGSTAQWVVKAQWPALGETVTRKKNTGLQAIMEASHALHCGAVRVEIDAPMYVP